MSTYYMSIEDPCQDKKFTHTKGHFLVTIKKIWITFVYTVYDTHNVLDKDWAKKKNTVLTLKKEPVFWCFHLAVLISCVNPK